ncbi:DUF2510 domain-containing protein [Agreia pratensis]|uniref:DUF2510 domain-containing protein n=1 Tax=Agreia pratensis TaxID=150121 RepID=A0A1X7ITA6_9MICO|nr:DUF2510 domain-containing protein [Agreia pratensis]SMG18060.1 Protein of unknown function [Agreia pratensis]
MTMAPGWYDAGTPGRVRWWDGVQWTAHEADANPQNSAAVDQPSSLTAPAPGWYETVAGFPRWWDGSHWTGLRIKRGVPGADWNTTEQPVMAWVLGCFFLMLALAQFGLGLLAGGIFATGTITFCLAVLWFVMAIQTTAVRRIPVPRSAAVAIDAVRPLPGEQEGADAGWYTVAPNVTRWWTGARWSQYIGTRYGPRPTFTGARMLRILAWMGWIFVGLGGVALVVGAVVLVGGIGANDFGLMAIIGGVILFGGVPFGALGAAVLLLSRLQRRTLLLPEHAPQRTVGAPRQ